MLCKIIEITFRESTTAPSTRVHLQAAQLRYYKKGEAAGGWYFGKDLPCPQGGCGWLDSFSAEHQAWTGHRLASGQEWLLPCWSRPGWSSRCRRGRGWPCQRTPCRRCCCCCRPWPSWPSCPCSRSNSSKDSKESVKLELEISTAMFSWDTHATSIETCARALVIFVPRTRRIQTPRGWQIPNQKGFPSWTNNARIPRLKAYGTCISRHPHYDVLDQNLEFPGFSWDFQEKTLRFSKSWIPGISLSLASRLQQNRSCPDPQQYFWSSRL